MNNLQHLLERRSEQPGSAHPSHQHDLVRRPLPGLHCRSGVCEPAGPSARSVSFSSRRFIVTDRRSSRPGSNTVPSEFHYHPADAGNPIAQSILGTYLETTGQIPITVAGDFGSSPYGSLQTGLSHVSLASSFPGQGIPLIHDIVVRCCLHLPTGARKLMSASHRSTLI